MVVGDIVSALKTVKDIVVVINNEAKELEKIKNDNTTKIINFVKSIHAIETCMDMLVDILSNTSDDFGLDLVMVGSLSDKVMEFSKTLKKYREWSEAVEMGSKWMKCKTLCCTPPSEMNKEINQKIDNCQDIIQIINDLKMNSIGSASQITNRILRRVWVYGRGKNQLGETQLPINMLFEAMYAMLKKEEGGELKNDKYCKDLIINLFNLIDGSSGTPPDGVISIIELNSLKMTEQNNENIKGLLGFERQPEEDEENIDVKIDFDKLEIDHKTGIEMEAKDVLYGSGFNNKKAFSFKIENREDNKKKLFGVKISCKANDQGWGGTGHCQIRYQVNEDVTKQAFSIWRTKNESGEYDFTLGPDKIKEGDQISVWLYCPAWSGWKCKMWDVNVVLKYC